MVSLSKLEKFYLSKTIDCDHKGYFKNEGNLYMIREPFDLPFKLKSFNYRGEIQRGKIEVENQGLLASYKFINPIEPKKPLKCDVSIVGQDVSLYIKRTNEQIEVSFENPIQGNFVLEYTII